MCPGGEGRSGIGANLNGLGNCQVTGTNEFAPLEAANEIALCECFQISTKSDCFATQSDSALLSGIGSECWRSAPVAECTARSVL